MTDNYVTDEGSGGNTYRSDEIGDVHWPYVKIAWGSDGTATICDTTNPLPIVLTAGSAAIGKLAANDGVDIGDVTVNNAADAGVYVRPGTGETWDVTQSGTWNVGTVTTLTGITNAVTIQDGGNTITVDGTVTANAGTNLNTSALALESGGNLAAAVTALQIMDDWDESDRAKVNPIAGQAGIAAGAGAVGVTVPRVTLASDDPAVALLTTIDSDTSKITACNTGAVVIASGTLTSITNSVAVTGTFWQTTQPVSGTFWQSTQPVSLASVPSHAVTNAGTFVVQVDGDALTALQLIDDAVAADGQAYGKGILIQGDDGSDRRAVLVDADGHVKVDVVTAPSTTVTASQLDVDSLDKDDDEVLVWANTAKDGTGTDYVPLVDADGHLQVDVLSAPTTAVTGTFWQTTQPVSGTFWQSTQPVSLASVPSHAVTNAGTFVIQENGDALTALQLIDDTVAVLGTATYSEATTKGNVIGAVRNDDLATLANTDNEIAPLQVDANGAVYTNAAAAENKSDSGVAAGGAPGTNDLIAAVSGKKLLVTALTLLATSTTTNTVYIDNADNMLLGDASNGIALSLDADGDTIPGIVLPYNPAGWFKTDTVTEAVTLNTSAAQDIIWSISWIETD